MKTNTLIGIVTFGNIEFTKLTINSIRETTRNPVDFYVIVGKPEDAETEAWLRFEGIPCLRHQVNRGFPASLNDIYDWAWKHHDYEHLIIAGNDIVPLMNGEVGVNGVDALIDLAKDSDWEWIASSQYDVRSLIRDHPEQAKYFEGPNCVFKDFTSRPWEVHKDFRSFFVEEHSIRDVHNLCLYKKSVMDRIGYIDVNFFPAYFSDNDYCVRGTIAGVKACTLPHSAYFHFWSRTIHQGSGGSTDRHCENNARFYRTKWGGMPGGREKWRVPFDGKDHCLNEGASPADMIVLPASLKIEDRRDELRIVEHWKEVARSG
jgi:GT2 family glycosyltransferase